METYLNKKGVRFWRDVHDATSGRLEKRIDGLDLFYKGETAKAEAR
jgi:hypothetical protein